MKQSIKSCAILGIASALATTTALSQNVITLDENGNGTFNGAALPGVLMPVDPSGGVAGPVLVYTLPLPVQVTVGDVMLNETAGTVTNLSDVVRFWNNNQVIFYSDKETANPGDLDLADSGLPAQLLSLQNFQFETGTEGNNGLSYLAHAGAFPGWDGNPAGTQYRFISDVPEPGCFALIGFGTLLALIWRRQARG